MSLFDRLDGADLVITGEGFLDAESFAGKTVGGVAALAAEMGIRCLAVAGRCYDGADARIESYSLVDICGETRAMTETAACIAEVVLAALG